MTKLKDKAAAKNTGRDTANNPVKNVVVSRCDRLGDLVLSLPALARLKNCVALEAESVILYCAPYAKAIGEWALANELCDKLWIQGEEAPAGFLADDSDFVSLFYSTADRTLLKKMPFHFSMGPRTKLPALWTYRCSVRQKRSRVEKSEMQYNVDLVDSYLRRRGIDGGEFKGLPALRVPSEWGALLNAALSSSALSVKSPELIVVASNRGSAGNLTLNQYLKVCERSLEKYSRVALLISEAQRSEAEAEITRRGFGGRLLLQGEFSNLRALIAYIAGAKKLIASSTGPLHIAHAAGVEVLGFYPRIRVQSFERWRPHGYWHTAPVNFVNLEDFEEWISSRGAA